MDRAQRMRLRRKSWWEGTWQEELGKEDQQAKEGQKRPGGAVEAGLGQATDVCG